MNILLYVLTMIMVLTALTYSRLESFRGYFGVQAGFKTYMQTTEREPIRLIAKRWYHDITLSTHKSDDRSKANTASPRLSFYTILNKEARLQNPDLHAQIREIAKKLMTILYHEKKTFIHMDEKNPQFLDALLDELEAASDKFYTDNEWKNVKTEVLSNLTLENQELRNVLYSMLKGVSTYSDPKKEQKKFTFQKPVAKKKVSSDEELAASIESKESRGEAGYDSLINFLTVNKKLKIRVFLASPQLLMAIYEDQKIVDEIVKERYSIYEQLQGGLNKSEGTQIFTNRFSQMGKAAQYPQLLDFGVSKTKPSRKKP